MDSRFSRIWLLTMILLVGIVSPSRAEVPPCEESVEDLWKFRQQVAAWTIDDGLSLVDGSLVQQLPGSCYIEDGQPIGLKQQIESLQPWSTSQASMEVGDGVQALWLIDRILCDQVAAGMPLDEKTRTELIDAVAECRAQFDAASTLEFPLSPTESISLGEAIEDLPKFRITIETNWHALDLAEQANVRGKLSYMESDLRRLHDDEDMFYLGPLRWDTVLATSPLPMPVGEENIDQYEKFVELAATYVALLEELEAKLATPGHPAEAAVTVVDAKTLESFRNETNPKKFREPLQIPPIAVTDNSWLINWLQSLFSRLRLNTALGEGMRWVALLLCAALLGWIAYLLVGGSDPWGNRAIRFRRGGDQEAVIRGRNLSPSAQFKLALEAARAGRHLEAWHWLTQGFILGLAQGELVKLDWSRTNREVLRDLQYKRVGFIEPATTFFRTAEGVVYGGRGTSLAEIEQFERSLSGTLASIAKKPK